MFSGRWSLDMKLAAGTLCERWGFIALRTIQRTVSDTFLIQRVYGNKLVGHVLCILPRVSITTQKALGLTKTKSERGRVEENAGGWNRNRGR
jgi:hypothetical protein